MTRIITDRHTRPLWRACSTLIVALATAVVSAQGPPDPPEGPRDKSRDPAAEQERGDFRPGMPGPRALGPQWPAPAGRGRAMAPAAPARLDELEAKLDTLLDEVRQLRRDIQRLRTNMQPSMGGPTFGPPFYPGAHRGGFGPGPAWAGPWGPRFQGPPNAFGPPPSGPGRGPQAMHGRASRGPRDENADRDADRPRDNDVKRGPAGPQDENVERRPDRPRDEREDPDRDRGDRDRNDRDDGHRDKR